MNSCYLCNHSLHSYVITLIFLSDSAAFLFHLFHLFWRANQLNSKNRRRFVSKVGHLWYFMGLSCKMNLRGESRPVLPLGDQPALFHQREGR